MPWEETKFQTSCFQKETESSHQGRLHPLGPVVGLQQVGGLFVFLNKRDASAAGCPPPPHHPAEGSQGGLLGAHTGQGWCVFR